MYEELFFLQPALLQLLCSLGTLRIVVRMLLYLQCYALVPLVRRKLPAPRAGLKIILESAAKVSGSTPCGPLFGDRRLRLRT